MHIHVALLCTGVGKRQTPSTGLAHPCCTSMHRCGEAANSKHWFGTSMLHFYAQVWGSGKLQALVWHIHAALLCTGVGKRQTPSTGLAHPCCTSMHRCGEAANSKHWFSTSMLHFYAQVWGSGKLQALVWHIHAALLCTGVGKWQTPSTGLQHPSSTHCHSRLCHRS